MSKHFKPGRPSIALKPSRIRRDPVRLQPAPQSKADIEKAEARAREREMWGGVAGVVLFAAAIAVAMVGIGFATFSKFDPAAAAREAAFGQCYNGGANCVLDGDTIYVDRQKAQIAGIAAPQIQGAKCADERSRGIEAAIRLAELLNGGKVSVGPAFRDRYGRAVSRVQVDGGDVSNALIAAGLARAYEGSAPDWCA